MYLTYPMAGRRASYIHRSVPTPPRDARHTAAPTIIGTALTLRDLRHREGRTVQAYVHRTVYLT
ncbi:hypothetical protein FAIPA1_210008 [Frankia sp. AiPs1]